MKQAFFICGNLYLFGASLGEQIMLIFGSGNREFNLLSLMQKGKDFRIKRNQLSLRYKRQERSPWKLIV